MGYRETRLQRWQELVAFNENALQIEINAAKRDAEVLLNWVSGAKARREREDAAFAAQLRSFDRLLVRMLKSCT